MRWIVSAIVLISMYSGGALACSCAQRGDDRAALTQALGEAELVFIGRIESKERFTADDEDGNKMQYERTQFYVLHSWKGEKASRVYVESNVTCCLCGYEFPGEGLFLVYASGPDRNGYYTTSTCHRTKPLEAARKEVAQLDEIVAEAKPTSSRERTNREKE